jgi:hypothetical protein
MYQVNCFLETINVPGKLFSVNPQKYQVNCFLGNPQKYQVNSFLETLKSTRSIVSWKPSKVPGKLFPGNH